jgi:hypothetical protein
MKISLKKTSILTSMATLGLLVTGCDSPAEKAAENAADVIEDEAVTVRDTGENVADKIEDRGDAAEGEMENKADGVRDAADNMADAMENNADAARKAANGK